MNITIIPTRLSGTVTPPGSKSQAHRLIIGAALSGGNTILTNVTPSQDIDATLRCMAALGAAARKTDESTLEITGIAGKSGPVSGSMDCGESGSTLRFLIPIALAAAGGGSFRGHGRLMERPQTPYFRLFREKGIFYALEGDTLTVRGTLPPGLYRLPGDVSSQFITGLLCALPLLEGDSEIQLTTPLESAGYVDMTLEALRHFGISVTRTKTGWRVPGNQKYVAGDARVEPDFSQAAFWYAARTMGSPVTVAGMNENSLQGDRAFLRWAEMVGGMPMTGGVAVPIWGTDRKNDLPSGDPGGCAVSIDVSQNPDLVPPLAAMGAVMNGALYIKNAGRLRLKESDRLASVTAVLTALGAKIEERSDGLTILGVSRLAGGGAVDSQNDHRIAMMTAIAATRCEKPVILTGAECVNKSYPRFWEDYAALGGRFTTKEK